MELEKSEKDVFLKEVESLRPDLFFPTSWDDDTRAAVLEEVRPEKVKTMMYAAIPMRCQAAKCPYADTCPLQQKNIAPEGLPCPIELQIVKTFMEDYVREFQVNPNSLGEMSMIRDLVDQEVQHMRKTRILAQEHFIQENPVGVDHEGRVVTAPSLHNAVAYEDAILKRKERLRNAFLATREAKAKAGQGALDAAQSLANLMDKVRDHQNEKQLEYFRKLGITPKDEYIEEAEIVEEEEGEEGEL